MTRPLVYSTFALPDAIYQRLKELADVKQWASEGVPDADTLLRNCKEADAILCALTCPITADLLAECQNLKVVSSCSVGVDHVDVEALNAKKIPLGYTPGVLVNTTAELTMALMLSASRRIVEADQYVRQGKWQPDNRWQLDMMLGQDLHEATLGIIGLGAIGQAVAKRAQAFGMKIIAWTPSGKKIDGIESVSLEQLYQRSDVISVHVAFSPLSHNMIDADAFAMMKANAIVVNTARGGIVNETALYEALVQKKIAAAALDVFAQEPVSHDNPLLSLSNVVVAPHIGSASVKTRNKMASLAADNVIAGLTNQPLAHCFNQQHIDESK